MKLSRKQLIYSLVPPREYRNDKTSQTVENWEVIILARHRNDCTCDYCSEAIKLLKEVQGEVANEPPDPSQ